MVISLNLLTRLGDSACYTTSHYLVKKWNTEIFYVSSLLQLICAFLPIDVLLESGTLRFGFSAQGSILLGDFDEFLVKVSACFSMF